MPIALSAISEYLDTLWRSMVQNLRDESKRYHQGAVGPTTGHRRKGRFTVAAEPDQAVVLCMVKQCCHGYQTRWISGLLGRLQSSK